MFRLAWVPNIVLVSALLVAGATEAQIAPAKPVEQTLQQKAEAGDPQSMYDLGVNYANGTGVTQDLATGFRWIRKAADAGNVGARQTMCESYMKGEFVALDPVTALPYCRSLAAEGNQFGIYYVGYAYEKGLGVAADPSAAAAYYRRGIDTIGGALFINAFAAVAATGKLLPADEAYAVRTARATLTDKVSIGACGLAMMYEAGRGVAMDIQQARWLYGIGPSGNKQCREGLARYKALPPLGKSDLMQGTVSVNGTDYGTQRLSLADAIVTYPEFASDNAPANTEDVTGDATIECFIGASLDIRECAVISERPANYRFGKAMFNMFRWSCIHYTGDNTKGFKKHSLQLSGYSAPKKTMDGQTAANSVGRAALRWN